MLPFLLLLNYNAKTFGGAILKSDSDVSRLKQKEQLVVAKVLEHESKFRKTMYLMGILGVVYMIATMMAIPNIKDIKDLYLYIVGWALFCFILDNQIKLHLMCNMVKKTLNEHR